jgi:hypothetical protein
MVEQRWDDSIGNSGWTDWRPAHAPTCRKGGCSRATSDESEWCETHLQEVTAQRAYVAWLQEAPDNGALRQRT